MHLTDWPQAGFCPPIPHWSRPWTRFARCARWGRRCGRPRSCGYVCRYRKSLLRWITQNSLRLTPTLIADELNVKAVELTDDIAAHGRFELAVNARAAGPRLGKAVQDAIKAVKAGLGCSTRMALWPPGTWCSTPTSTAPRLVAADPDSTAALAGRAGLVVLDCAVTPELEAEAGPGPNP